MMKYTAVAAAIPGVSGTAAAETVDGITFDRVVDAVADLGMDDTGTDPIDNALADALQSGTLIEFPPGKYLVTQRHSIQGLDRIGLRGLGQSRRDVQFLPGRGQDIRILDSGRNGSGRVLLENISFNDRSDDTSITSIFIRTSGGSVARNIEWLGRTPRVEQGTGTDFQFGTEVTEQSGIFLVEDVTAGIDEPAAQAPYPDGVGFFWSGPGHRGEVILRNPVLHNRNSAPTRYNAGPGVVTIEGGEFVDCQNASVRFGAGSHPSKVSSCTGTYVKVGADVTDAGEAIRIGGPNSPIESGAICRDMTIEWERDQGRGVFSLVDFSPHGSLTIDNCIVRNEGPNTPSILAQSAGTTSDVAITITNSSFTGSGDGDFIAQNRPGSVIRDSCISMSDVAFRGFDTENISTDSCRRPGADESGGDVEDSNSASSPVIQVADKDALSVDLSAENSSDDDGEIAACKWDVNGTVYRETNTTHTFPAPGAYDVALTVEDGDGATASTTSEVTVGFQHSLTVQGTGETAQYVVEVDGDIAPVQGTIESWDDTQDASATGWVTYAGTTDEYTFDGQITSFEFSEGQADVFVDGDRVDPSTLGTADTKTRRIDIEGAGTPTNYVLNVSDSLEGINSSLQSWDTVEGTTATGWVTEPKHVDSFHFTGEITSLKFRQGEATVYVDGEVVSQPSSLTRLKIQGTGEPAQYAVEVDGSITAVDDTVEPWDEVSQSSATGWVTLAGHSDEYIVEGEITSLTFREGEGAVFVDGNQVDPSTL